MAAPTQTLQYFVVLRSADLHDYTFGATAEPTFKLTTRRAIFLKDVRHYVENHCQQIVILFIFFTISVLLFAERFFSNEYVCSVSSSSSSSSHRRKLVKRPITGGRLSALY